MSSLSTKILNFFKEPTSEELIRIPQSLKHDIENILQENEELVHIIRTYKSRYKAQRLLDGNSFYNAIMILTTKRVIIARNSSRLIKFRDIPLNLINNYTYESTDGVPVITLNVSDGKDILTFAKNAFELTNDVSDSLKKLMKDKSINTLETVYCRFCGKQIPTDSKFCMNCGEKLS